MLQPNFKLKTLRTFIFVSLSFSVINKKNKLSMTQRLIRMSHIPRILANQHKTPYVSPHPTHRWG